MSNTIKWGLVVLLVFYVVTQPSNAAGVVHSAFGAVHNAATGVGQFITNLAP